MQSKYINCVYRFKKDDKIDSKSDSKLKQSLTKSSIEIDSLIKITKSITIVSTININIY
jgi:hypothetical protein